MGKKIVLISDKADDVTFLSEVCSVTQATLQVSATPKSAIDFLAAEECSAIFIDVDHLSNLHEFELEAQKRFGLFSDQVQAHKFHFMSDKPLHDNRDVIQSPFFGSYYRRPESEVELNGKFYGHFVLASEQMETHRLSHFLSEKGKVQEVMITHSDQKQEAAEAVRQYLIAAKVPARISNIIANTVDELLMNAIFDAPCDDLGKNLYTTTARNQSREMPGKEKVKMAIGFDGFHVGISVTDQFGSLDRNRLLSHVSMNYKNRDYLIKQGQAGAGLGLATVFNSGGSLIYHCEAKSKTEVTLLYRVFPSYREFKGQFRFFSAKFYV